MSKWKQINSWFKQHYLCVVAWFVVVLISLIVVMAGNDKELVGYFSFACSLSGILLAMVVIIHTWIDSADTRTVLTEVKSHLTTIQGDVGKQAERVEQLNTVLGKELKDEVTSTDTAQGIVLTSDVARVDTESFQFKIPKLRNFPLLSLYIAVKSSQVKQTFNEVDIVIKVFPKYENDFQFIMFFSGLLIGTLTTAEALLEFEYGTLDFNAKRNGSVRVGQMSEKICQAVTDELIRRIEKPDKEDLKILDNLISQKEAIDDFFDAS